MIIYQYDLKYKNLVRKKINFDEKNKNLVDEIFAYSQ